MKDCKVCLIAHDEEIHAATVSVRTWFHQQVVQGFYGEEVLDANPQPEVLIQAVA